MKAYEVTLRLSFKLLRKKQPKHRPPDMSVEPLNRAVSKVKQLPKEPQCLVCRPPIPSYFYPSANVTLQFVINLISHLNEC